MLFQGTVGQIPALLSVSKTSEPQFQGIQQPLLNSVGTGYPVSAKTLPPKIRINKYKTKTYILPFVRRPMQSMTRRVASF